MLPKLPQALPRAFLSPRPLTSLRFSLKSYKLNHHKQQDTLCQTLGRQQVCSSNTEPLQGTGHFNGITISTPEDVMIAVLVRSIGFQCEKFVVNTYYTQ